MIKPFFQIEFGVPVWKLLADEATHLLAVEIRSQPEKYADFATIDLTGGEVLCNGLVSPPENDWLCSLEAVGHGVLFLSHFADEQNPVRSGITAVNAATGENLWHLDSYTYSGFVDTKTVLLSDVKSRQHRLARLSDGILLPDDQHATQTVINKTTLLYPTAYTEEQSHFETIAQWIQAKTGHQPAKIVEYLETDTCFVTSYHICHPKSYDLHLLVADMTGNILLQVCPGTAMRGCASGTFFVLSKSLIFVKDKVILHAYLLP